MVKKIRLKKEETPICSEKRSIPENEAAVVFDCAGTLVDMFRVTKDVKNNSFISVADNFKLVESLKNCGIVVFDTKKSTIRKQDPQRLASDFVENDGIRLSIAFSNEKMYVDDVIAVLKKNKIRMKEFLSVIEEVDMSFTDRLYEVTGFLADVENEEIPYVMSSGGNLFPETKNTVKYVQKIGADVFIASGDDCYNLYRVADKISVDHSNVFGLMDANAKKKLIDRLKKKYRRVIMVGDGLNDMQALDTADVGILISKKEYYSPKKLKYCSDHIVTDI